MKKYRLYKSNSEKLGQGIKSIMKKRGQAILAKTMKQFWDIDFTKLKKDAIESADSFTVGYEIGMAASTIDENTKRVLIVEKIARDNSNKTIFVESQDLIEALVRSKIKVDKSVLIAQKPDPFLISVACGTIVDGVEIRPFIFMVDGGMFPGLTAKSNTIDNVGYVMGVEDAESPQTENLYSCFSYEQLENNFSGKEKTKWDRICSVHAKLGYSLYCYMKAFPECVVSGAPSSVSVKEIFHGGRSNRLTPFKIAAPIDSSTGVALHLRRGHFRSLHDKRFKRNQDGSIKIVWVKDTVVGGKIDPYTVESIL